MRLDPVFDSVYLLSSLWGMAGSRVCPVNPTTLPRPALEATWAPLPGRLALVTAFVDVNVVPMDTERVLPHQTVLVEGGRITALGPAGQVQVPAGAVRIDGRGKYLMPGLADMHEHDLRKNFRELMSSHMADGVTALRTLEGPKDESMPEWRSVLKETPGLRLYLPRVVDITMPPDRVAAFVAETKALGYYHLGGEVGFGGTTSPRHIASHAALDSLLASAHRVGLPVSVHSHRLPFETALRVGAAGGSIEHISSVFWDSLGFWDVEARHREPPADAAAKIRTIAAALHRAGVWITPTLRCIQKHSPTSTYHELTRQIVKTLQEAGVGMFLAADDAFDVHEELEAMVRAGLTPYQALVTGTRNVAQYFRLLDSTGTVATGKWADLVLLSDNPLANVRHAREPVGVMIDGRWFDRAALDRGLLTSLRTWLESTVNKYGIRGDNTKSHASILRMLADSLEAAAPSEKVAHERLRRRFAAELGALRAILTPEQQGVFDPRARVWVREQVRQGYQVTVPGVVLVP